MYLVGQKLREREVDFEWMETMEGVSDAPGFNLVDHGQGGSYSRDINKLVMGRSLRMLQQRMDWSDPQIMIERDRFLSWQCTCTTVIENKGSNERNYLSVTRTKSVKSYNDGWISLVMAVGAADWKMTQLEGMLPDMRSVTESYVRAIGLIQ